MLVEAARRATDADLTTLVRLWRSAVAETAAKRGGAALIADLTIGEPLEATLRAVLTNPGRLLVSGCIDDAVVGIAAAHVRRPPSSPARPAAMVELFYVEPEARGVGVGETMVDLVTAWGAGLGCHGVDAPALPGARDAKAFFETSGLVARLLIMHRPIGPGRPWRPPAGTHGDPA